MKLRNYSPRTIDSYLNCLLDFFHYLKIGIETLNIAKIKTFLLQKQDKHYAPQTINLYLNSIKFFYREVLKNPKKIDLKFAKRSKKLPIVLSREEIASILAGIQNSKHRLIVALSYGAGLRISEAMNLKVRDINMKELTIHLKETKGQKDRLTVFPEKLKTDIQNLIAGKLREEFVFLSERGGRLTTRSAQKIFGKALKLSGKSKPATFHSLRHSFATHLDLLQNNIMANFLEFRPFGQKNFSA